MYIERLELHNFKCLKNLGLDFSKITVLTGANSSGKSSVIYGLLGALQTNGFPFFFSPNGNFVDMGDFKEMVFHHNNKDNIGIVLKITDTELGDLYTEAKYYENYKNKMPRLLSLLHRSNVLELQIEKFKKYKAELKYSPQEDHYAELASSEDFADVMNALIRIVAKEREQESETSKKNQHELTKEEMVNLLTFKESEVFFSFLKPEDFPVELWKQIKSMGIGAFRQVLNLFSKINDINNNFNYLSSYRYPPARTYYQSSKADLKVGKYGENYIDQISAWDFSRSGELDKLKQYMREFELLNDIRTKRMRGGRFDIEVQVDKVSVKSPLVDVGFGVSQLLPIIIADLQLGKKSTLAISQPEIHLHPSVQAQLANYFAERVLTDEKRYIIETHSEYFLNRLRLLRAKGVLDENDLSIIYLRNTEDGALSFDITFSDDGQIHGAPNDFFDTYMMDVMNIALEA